jgi:hypothetical protein
MMRKRSAGTAQQHEPATHALHITSASPTYPVMESDYRVIAHISGLVALQRVASAKLASIFERRSNERCSRQALFGCGFAAMVVLCLQLN